MRFCAVWVEDRSHCRTPWYFTFVLCMILYDDTIHLSALLVCLPSAYTVRTEFECACDAKGQAHPQTILFLSQLEVHNGSTLVSYKLLHAS